MKNNQVLVSGTVVFKKGKNGRTYWLLVKQNEEEGWEIAKIIARKGESSVRAAIRMMGEQGGMAAQVIEEVGRYGGSTTINGKVVPRRHLYYLMKQKSAGEMFGFENHSWVLHKTAVKELSSKREKKMMREAIKELHQWRQKRKKRVI